jgi:uncharacterized protein YqeY
MSVLAAVQKALDIAIRGRDVATRTTLKTLLGEAQTRTLRDGSEVDDVLLIKLLKDFMKGNCDSLALRDNPGLVRENEILSLFIPKQMDESEIRAAILSSGSEHIGGVMKHLKTHHAGLYNGQLANALTREMLSVQ